MSNEETFSLAEREEVTRDSEGFGKFELERDKVGAEEIFETHDVERRIERRHARAAGSNDNFINRLDVHNLPEEILPQDLQAEGMAKQAEALLGTELAKALQENSRTPLRFRAHKMLMKATIQATTHFADQEGIVLRHGSAAEQNLAWLSFMIEWPTDPVDLYDPLKEGYPPWHAQMVGQRPRFLDGPGYVNMYLERGLSGTQIKEPALLKTSVIGDRLMGLYPVIEMPPRALTEKAEWKSQDQIGRREQCNRILSRAEELLAENPNEQITVIDYAGGVGNLTEVLFEQIEAMQDVAARERIVNNLKIVVRELHQGQIDGGEAKFSKLEEKHKWIAGKYCFVQSDITEPMDEEQKAKLTAKFGDKYDLDNQVILGMTAYTAGALPPEVLDQMAVEIKANCYYFDAIDFSSPAWRQEAFLKDTGQFGVEYLRTIHGIAGEHENVFAKKWVRMMSLGPGLADQYAETWPGEWGHNSGYGVEDDGTLRKPSIVTLAEHFEDLGLPVKIKSAVNTFSYLYAGETERGKAAIALVPGWVRDDIKVTNTQNRQPKALRKDTVIQETA